MGFQLNFNNIQLLTFISFPSFWYGMGDSALFDPSCTVMNNKSILVSWLISVIPSIPQVGIVRIKILINTTVLTFKSNQTGPLLFF